MAILRAGMIGFFLLSVLQFSQWAMAKKMLQVILLKRVKTTTLADFAYLSFQQLSLFVKWVSKQKWVITINHARLWQQKHHKQQPFFLHQTPFHSHVGSFCHIFVTTIIRPFRKPRWYRGSTLKFWVSWVTTFFCEPTYLGSVSSMMVMWENSSIFWCVDVLKWNHKVPGGWGYVFKRSVEKKRRRQVWSI